MASRGQYGSRSFERSLHYPRGFEIPAHSLSPIATCFASESAKEPYPATATVAPSQILLVQNRRITTQSIADFGYQTRAVLEKLEQEHRHPDGVEAAAFPALTLLLNGFKEFKHGGGMTIQELDTLGDAAGVFLTTLDWTNAVGLPTADRDGLAGIETNLQQAFQLLERQREQGLAEDQEREKGRPLVRAQSAKWDVDTRTDYMLQLPTYCDHDLEYDLIENCVKGW